LADEAAGFLPSGTLESFRAALGLSYAQAGAVLALIAPGALLGTGFTAATDRFSRRAIAAGGAFGFAASLVLFAAGGSFAALAAAAVVMGAASTAMVDAVEVALVDLAGDDLRRYLARSNLLGAVGDLVGPVLVAAVAAVGLSWRAVFWCGAVIMALYGVLLSKAPLPHPSDRANDGDGEEQPASLRRRLAAVLRDPAVWALAVIGMLLVPFDEPLTGFSIALLERDGGASVLAATVAAVVGLSGGLLAFTVLARRAEGMEDRRLLAGAVAAMTVGTLVIPVAPRLAVVAGGLFVASVGLNLAWLGLQHRSLTLRPGQAGTTVAVLGAIEVAGFWIPAAIGAVADRAGLPAAIGTYAVFGLLMLLLAGGAVSGRPRP
jgi:predicted MFS family arabinose efflux permease